MARGHRYHTERLATLLSKIAEAHGVKLPQILLRSKVNERLPLQTPLSFVAAPVPTTLDRMDGLPIKPSTSIRGRLEIEAASKSVFLKWGRTSRPAKLVFTLIKQHGFIIPFSTHVALASWEGRLGECYEKPIVELDSYEYYPFLGLLFPKGGCSSAGNLDFSGAVNPILVQFTSQPLPHYMNARYALYSVLSGSSVEATKDNKHLVVSSANIAYVCLKSEGKQPKTSRMARVVGGELCLWRGDVLLPAINVGNSARYTRLFTDVWILATKEDAMFIQFAGGCTPALLMTLTLVPISSSARTQTLYIIVEVPRGELILEGTPAASPYAMTLTHLAGCLTSKAIKVLASSVELLRRIQEILGRVWLIDAQRRLKDAIARVTEASRLDIRDCITAVDRAITKHWVGLLKKLGFDPKAWVTLKTTRAITEHYANLICRNGCRHPLLEWTAEVLAEAVEEGLTVRSDALAKAGTVVRVALKLAERASLLFAELRESKT